MKIFHQRHPFVQTEKSNTWLAIFLLSFVSAAVYLPFISRFGYFNDDWYLMYAAGANGPAVFWSIFSIDRPWRALVMIPAYSLFGANPLYYNLSAYLFRLISGLFFLWILNLLWPERRRMNLWMSLLFLIYPGFLSQPNAIDYLCHLVGLAAGMLSIALTVKAIQSNTWQGKSMFYIPSILLGWFYLGQIEWYIGLEFFRFAVVLLLSWRLKGTIWERMVRFFQWALPAVFIPIFFLVWRLFFFKSERGATDIDLQLGGLRATPITFLPKLFSTLSNDFLDVLIRAWAIPLKRLSYGVDSQGWMIGYGIAVLLLVVLWIVHKLIQRPREMKPEDEASWRREVIWIGLGSIVFGLLPVVLVGRTVDFKSFSRYTLIASVGAALLWPVVLSYIPVSRLRYMVFCLFICIASLTHYANGLAHSRESDATRNFWWQVSWRIPQLGVGTTMIAHYSVVAEEDYFTWGPANLIYYPESNNQSYIQPAIYAVLLNQETVSKVLTHTRQEYSNRRSIVTYPNYRHILILTQPTPLSCVQVMDFNQVELSSAEDARVVALAPYSETEHIMLGEAFHTPPVIPFGSEPIYGWCYYYEKAAYAREMGKWDDVFRLGEEALALGYSANDQIEWMPFLQAYAYFGDFTRLKELASFVSSDQKITQQACHILTGMSLDSPTSAQVNQLFCF